MTPEIFVDTSGFYALLIRRDDQHQRASRILREAAEAKRRFATTDYVLDETATLMKARGHAHLLDALFQTVFASRACRVEWTDEERFDSARSLFLQQLDRPWSFTDCLSFRVMRELRLRDALTKDGHFAEAGFTALLVD
jgi:predicted nucleic acid-binding protein